MALIPLTKIEKIMKNEGAESISDRAKTTMEEFLEEVTVQITERALMHVKQAKRNKVTKEDIQIAKKEVWG